MKTYYRGTVVKTVQQGKENRKLTDGREAESTKRHTHLYAEQVFHQSCQNNSTRKAESI